ncbi:hypothetical protein UCREL1_6108 [Eutypa lata UCREL1]|uniref:Uncharacterized protein n=1 Tax=Eutypa lata (strain UCR-EL1) TaxID=1287681 RepID=M7TJJ1_EUTLA|nr:hypothetical protein UCREL1_6108 [Eutypa lata UCREL1]
MPSLSSILSRLQPFGLGWLVVFLSVSTWSNLYVFCWYVRVTPDIVSTIQPVPVVNSLGFGLFLLVISAIFKANWVGAWVQSLVITWFCDRKWKPSRACKDIMQVDSAAWQGAHSSQRGVWIRYQEVLTIKNQVSVLASVIDKATAGVFPTVRRLVDKNCLDMETDYSPKVPRAWNFAFRYGPTAEPRLHLKTFKGQHPWDLGIKENTCQVLGRHWWQRFLFCWQPERVARYGQYGGRDLPYADFIVRNSTGPDQARPD